MPIFFTEIKIPLQNSIMPIRLHRKEKTAINRHQDSALSPWRGGADFRKKRQPYPCGWDCFGFLFIGKRREGGDGDSAGSPCAVGFRPRFQGAPGNGSSGPGLRHIIYKKTIKAKERDPRFPHLPACRAAYAQGSVKNGSQLRCTMIICKMG